MPHSNFQVETSGYLTSSTLDSSGVSLIDSPMAVSSFPYTAIAALLNGSRFCIYDPLSRVFDICKIVSPDQMSCVRVLFEKRNEDSNNINTHTYRYPKFGTCSSSNTRNDSYTKTEKRWTRSSLDVLDFVFLA